MKYLLCILLPLTWLSCSQTEKREIYDSDGETVVGYQRVNKNTGLKEGDYETYYDDGSIYDRGQYKNDSLHGERTIYFPDGSVNIVEHYDDGTIDGDYLVYFSNGNKNIEGQFEDGVAQGPWRVYYETGNLKEVVEYADNVENGPFEEYYENGNIKAKGVYRNGDNEHGELLLYNEDGVLIKKMSCNVGICQTTWTLEREMESE